MAQLFPAWTNSLLRIGLVAVLALPLLGPMGFMFAGRATNSVNDGRALRQPLPFSHQRHVGELRIDCRYCHAMVETSSAAGMPTAQVCLTCHAQLWPNDGLLASVRERLAEGEPLRWQRLNLLPDDVYFDHSIHSQRGVGCESCHGRIDEMPLTYSRYAFLMGFCLDCHREPGPLLRPLEQVTAMGWQPEEPQLSLLEAYQVRTEQLTDCSICHR